MTPEARVTDEIMLETSRSVAWFRNNSGLADFGTRKVRYGLGGVKGTADWIGIVRKSGRFVAMEVKAPNGKTTKEQDAFLEAVRRAGGVAFVARCPDDVWTALREAGEV